MKWILSVGVAVALTAFVAFYPPAKLGAWYLIGRSPECAFAQAIQADAELKDQVVRKDRILAATKVVETDAQGMKLYATPHGSFWAPPGNEYILPWNLAEMERDIYGRGPQAIRAGDVVLDCGASIGDFTRAALAKGARLVVAVEPAPEHIECLRRNLKAEIEAGRVIIYPKGVWDKDDVLEFNVDPKNTAANSFVIQRDGSHKVRLPLTTIDKLAAELKLDRIDFIKMDIEGAEPNAVRGAAESIRKWKPRLALSTYHAPDHPRLIPSLVRTLRNDYAVACGPCAVAERSIRPDVVYFY